MDDKVFFELIHVCVQLDFLEHDVNIIFIQKLQKDFFLFTFLRAKFGPLRHPPCCHVSYYQIIGSSVTGGCTGSFEIVWICVNFHRFIETLLESFIGWFITFLAIAPGRALNGHWFCTNIPSVKQLLFPPFYHGRYWCRNCDHWYSPDSRSTHRLYLWTPSAARSQFSITAHISQFTWNNSRSSYRNTFSRICEVDLYCQSCNTSLR